MNNYSVTGDALGETAYTVLSALVIILFFVFIYFRCRKTVSKFSPNFRRKSKARNASNLGDEGEKEIGDLLKKLDKPNYIVLHNLVLLNNNSTHQIDHVVVSNYGIFVIETKNYSGFIKGSEKYRKWIHFIGKKKYLFLNPIIQNKGHIKALEAFLPEYSSYFIPIVCFTEKTKLAVKTSSIVINSSALLYIISNYRTEVLIPDINEVAQNLKNVSLSSMYGINEDHLNNISKYK